jgi:uncharacterized iron-regulated protein
LRIVWFTPLAFLLGCSAMLSDVVENPTTAAPLAAATLAELEASFLGADIVILGEVHDNAVHHHNQARIIRDLQPSAVLFEMLSPQQTTRLNERSERGEDLRALLDWDNSGWPDWSLYQPVFEALGDIPAYGMALPRDMVRAAVTDGAAAVFGAGAEDFGLTRALDTSQQQTREALQQTVHCNALPPSLLPGMVEAQRLRDAAFARTTLQALRETGGPVVVITGSGHARSDWGMPAALRHARPAARVVSVGQLEAAPDTQPPYDLWLITEPAVREDPCAGFSMPGNSKTSEKSA